MQGRKSDGYIREICNQRFCINVIVFIHMAILTSLEIERIKFDFTADRAKQIKTTAKVNEDPTEKLIRELKEENEKLMEMLKKAQAGETVKISADDDDDDDDNAGQKEGMSEEGDYEIYHTCKSNSSEVVRNEFFYQ